MQVVFKLPRHPSRLDALHPRLIEDLLEIAEHSQDAVNAIITMLEDFHHQGTDSRYIKKLQGLPLFELKTRSRGQAKGGARVYFYYQGDQSTAVLVNAEVKAGDSPDPHKLQEALEIYLADRAGTPLY